MKPAVVIAGMVAFMGFVGVAVALNWDKIQSMDSGEPTASGKILYFYTTS